MRNEFQLAGSVEQESEGKEMPDCASVPTRREKRDLRGVEISGSFVQLCHRFIPRTQWYSRARIDLLHPRRASIVFVSVLAT